MGTASLLCWRKRRKVIVSNQKYEITDIVHEEYPFLHRIRALQDIGGEVKTGDLGGFVEKEWNLSFKPGDAAWIFDDAIAAGNVCVDKGAHLRERAVACHQAYVSQGAMMSGDAIAGDQAYVRGAMLSGHARAAGTSLILDGETGAPVVAGNCIVYGKVSGNIRILGKTVVLGGEEISHDHPDTLVLDGPNRAILLDPARDRLTPQIRTEKVKKPKQREVAR